MIDYADILSFFVGLGVNLILTGFLILAGVIAALRLTGKASSLSRIRCLLIAGAFLTASFMPPAITLYATLRQSSGQIPASGAEQVISDIHKINSSETAGAPQQFEEYAPPRTTKPKAGFLNDFVYYIGHSRAGVVFFCVWIIISAILIFRQITGYRRLRGARKIWQPAKPEELEELSCSRNIPLYFAENEGPCAAGLFRPVVVLPRRFPDDLSIAAVRCIVRHELDHARWRDPLVSFLLHLIYSVFWISPALWFLKNAARTEQEAAADFAALSGTGNLSEAAVEYASLLVSIARFSNTANQSATAVNFTGATQLETRVCRILAASQKITGIRLFPAFTVFAASLSGIFFIPAVSQPLKIFRLQETSGKTRLAAEPEPPGFTSLTGDKSDTAKNNQEKDKAIVSTIRTKQKSSFGVGADKNKNLPGSTAATPPSLREKQAVDDTNEIGKSNKTDRINLDDELPANIAAGDLTGLNIPGDGNDSNQQPVNLIPKEKLKKLVKISLEKAGPFTEMSGEQMQKFVKDTFETITPYLNKTKKTSQ